MKTFGTYTITFASAGQSLPLPVAGDYVKVITSSGPVDIRVDGGALTRRSIGQGFQLPPGDSFSDLLITNRHTGAQSVEIFVGFGRDVDQTSNVVPSPSNPLIPMQSKNPGIENIGGAQAFSIVDQLNVGGAFTGFGYYSYLINPLGSGKVAYVNGWRLQQRTRVAGSRAWVRQVVGITADTLGGTTVRSKGRVKAQSVCRVSSLSVDTSVTTWSTNLTGASSTGIGFTSPEDAAEFGTWVPEEALLLPGECLCLEMFGLANGTICTSGFRWVETT
jgi:hypothetical protein